MGFHIVKRDQCPLWKKVLFYVIAVVLGLVIGGVLLSSNQVDPIGYYFEMFTLGTVDNIIAFRNYMNFLEELVPLALTSIALSLAFKMRFWNIGGEGQFIMGAIAAATVAFKVEGLSVAMTLVLMCLAAMLAAGLYGLIAAALKVKFGTNETLLTLMLNYIALYFLSFLAQTKKPWNFFLQEESARPVFKSFAEDLHFPTYPMGPDRFELNLCVILVALIGILVYVYLRYTKQGYEISVVGDSINTARYAGMKVNRIILRTVFLSSCLVGLAAAFQVGTDRTLSETVTNDVGWTGIVVAWLSHLNTIAILFVSTLICVLHYGSTEANVLFPTVDANFANILQGVLLFLALAADFMIRFRIVRSKKGGNKDE